MSASEPLVQTDEIGKTAADGAGAESVTKVEEFGDVRLERHRPGSGITMTFAKRRFRTACDALAVVLFLLFGVGFLLVGTLTGVDASFGEAPLYVFIPAFAVVGCLILVRILASAGSTALELTPGELAYRVQGVCCYRRSVVLPRRDIHEVKYIDRKASGSGGKYRGRKVALLVVVMQDGAVHEFLSRRSESEARWATARLIEELPEIAI